MANSNIEDIRKKQILDSALQNVIQKGYTRCRMDDIVESSQLSKGAIYWYFDSKKEVFLSLVNYWVNTFAGPLNAIIKESPSPTQQLEKLFELFLRDFTNNPDVFKAELEFWALARRDKDFHKKMQKVYHQFLELIETILEKGVALGEFKTIDIRSTALAIMINLEGVIWFTLFETEGVTVKQYIYTMKDFIIRGVSKT